MVTIQTNNRGRPRWRKPLSQALVLFMALLPHLSAAGTGTAFAKDLTEMSIEDLMTVEVTSTVARKAQRVTETAAAVYVITAEDIRRSGVTSIPEALRMVPGLEVARIDANKWAISARGFNGYIANKLLVLMDGRTVYSQLYSGVYWDMQDTLMEDIARIEVIRGPGASLWGANAVNGVINIITKGAAETQGGLAAVGVGTEERFSSGLRYGGKMGDSAYYRAYGKYFDRDGGVAADGGEAHDQWYAGRGGGRIDWNPTSGNAVTVQGDYFKGASGGTKTFASFDPPYSTTYTEEYDQSGGNLLGRWQRTFSTSSDFILQAYFDRTERFFPLLNETRDSYDLDFQHRFGLGRRQEVMWGWGYRLVHAQLDDSDIVSFSQDDRKDQLFSFFAQDDIALLPDKLSLLLGSKFEKNDYTGWETQPNARLLWTPHQQHTFWSAVSKAVRTPSQAEHDTFLVQRIIPGSPNNTMITFQGDEDYGSEDLTAYEVGYRYHPVETIYMDLALFYNQYDHLRTVEMGAPYLWGSPPYQVLPFVVANNMKGHTSGAELAVEYRPLNWWRLIGAYTYLEMSLETLDGSNDFTSVAAEDESPHHQFSLRSMMDIATGWELDLWGRYVDELPAQDIRSYITMDARLGWRPTPHWEFSLVGQNLLSPSHPEFSSEIIDFAPTEVQRSVYVKAVWRF
ncbi:MAG: TonB-dependent receptor [Desulfobacteraceae bacterium]|nr:TonB-dependent receptor [Desulfobacteraceae bacterium]